MQAAREHHEGDVMSPSQIQAFAARNFELLQLVERTIQRTEADRAFFAAANADIRRVIDSLSDGSVGGPIDPEGRTSDLLRRGAEAAARFHAELISCRDSARRDKDLREDDGVPEAFARLADEVSEFHNGLEDLRDAVETLDALHDQRHGPFDSVDALMASLRA